MPDKATMEAARWDARLRSPECRDKDRDDFADWHATHANAAAYANLQAAVQLLSVETPQAAPVRTGTTGRRTFAVAGSVAASVSLLVGVWPQFSNNEMRYVTPAGAIRPIRLTDGSLIEMSPGSAVDVIDARRGLNVTLIRGSARFSVNADAARPVVVKVGDRQLTGRGAAFKVRLATGHVLIDLGRGTAQVHCWHGLLPSRMVLHAGQRLDAEIGSDRAQVTDSVA